MSITGFNRRRRELSKQEEVVEEVKEEVKETKKEKKVTPAKAKG
ncbi:hypothetical protein P4534_21270 [Peribacillus butanolivorans]|nr:hypothetical protein [Peribacillus butanolivorans]